MAITRRESAIAFNLGMPLDRELKPVAEKRVRDNANRDTTNSEWHLQAACIKECRAKQARDKTFNFMAPGAAQNKLTPEQRMYAKIQGYQAGILDIWLMRPLPGPALKMAVVELKLPNKPLTDEQEAWFLFLGNCGVARDRVDNLKDFLNILDHF